MSDVLTQLLGFRWRDVSFPVNEMTLEMRQDLVQHKFFRRDGADVEATGRAPLQVSATIPFRNGVVPGLSEDYRILYPDGYRSFLAAMADKTVGSLRHPELGDLQMLPDTCTTVWSSARRDGVDVTATWIETTEFDDSLQTALGQSSPIAAAEYAALTLDTALRLPDDQIPRTPEFEPTFGDSMRQIAGIGDQVSLASNRVTGKVDQVAYRVNNVKRSFERAGNPRNFGAQQALEQMQESLRDIAQRLGAGQRPVSFYRAPKDITLAGLADLIPAKLGELMRMNPRLLGSPVVPANTTVRFLKVA